MLTHQSFPEQKCLKNSCHSVSEKQTKNTTTSIKQAFSNFRASNKPTPHRKSPIYRKTKIQTNGWRKKIVIFLEIKIHFQKNKQKTQPLAISSPLRLSERPLSQQHVIRRQLIQTQRCQKNEKKFNKHLEIRNCESQKKLKNNR